MHRSLLVSTGIGCGVLCSYCPQEGIGRAYRARTRNAELSMETFTACLDKLPADVSIHFNGFYEPWLNRDCAGMLRYAHQQGFRVRVSTTLMGLELDDIERIKHIPFTKFAIHLPDDKQLTRIKVDAKYLSVLLRLIESNISNIAYHVHEGASGPENVHSEVAVLLDRRGIVPENRWVNTRAGNIALEGKASRKRLGGELEMCPRLQSSVLLPNGDVALCCMDWRLKHVIGNLLTMEYEALFESEEYKRVLSGYVDESVDILCRYCEIAQTRADARRRAALRDLQSQRSTRLCPSLKK